MFNRRGDQSPATGRNPGNDVLDCVFKIPDMLQSLETGHKIECLLTLIWLIEVHKTELNIWVP